MGQRMHRALDLRLDHPPHLEDAGGDAGKLGIELGRDVSIVHGVPLGASPAGVSVTRSDR
jgi:hypothetical protein